MKKPITANIVSALHSPPPDSRKGDNGRLLIIGGSELFHGASLWTVKIASRIVDLVFYHSSPENLKIGQKALLFDFIPVLKKDLDTYCQEADAILIGPGLVRTTQTRVLTNNLLEKYPKKRWIIDAGSLQMMDKKHLRKNQIITPHLGEFEKVFNPPKTKMALLKKQEGVPLKAKLVQKHAKEYGCVILLKGKIDIIASPRKWAYNTTGNQGMTKGGTGDVLAGLVAALACKNELFLSACAGAYINGLAGDQLKKKVGIYFNASDLCDQIPRTLKEVTQRKAS